MTDTKARMLAKRLVTKRMAAGAYRLTDGRRQYVFILARSEDNPRTAWTLVGDNAAAYELLGRPERYLTFGKRADARLHVQALLRDAADDEFGNGPAWAKHED